LEQLIIGTAGHVDHGKTVLIKALTGVDTDRLQEEKERGISIDLGFAPFLLPSGRLAGVVDVPGHERFIHNMLAGAAGMDLVMLVVDAAEGVMPQTREHLDILQLLGIQKGIVVITKIDLVEEEWRELVSEEISEELKGTFLESAPVLAVSAVTGEGIDALKELIDQMTESIESRSSSGPLRLPVDRSFVIAGFGTVITGTLVQGAVKVGDTVAIVPPGLEARVRNVQVHDADVKEARAGARVALNLAGLEKELVQRGSVISSPGYYRQTALLDVTIQLLSRAPRKLKNLDPVHFFLGTARTVARILLLDRDELLPGESSLAQCRLDRPLVAERGDPFVIRSYSPMTTIGGGKVLDPYPSRHRRFKNEIIGKLKDLDQDSQDAGDTAFVSSKLQTLVVAELKKLIAETRLPQETIKEIIEQLIQKGQVSQLGDSYLTVTALEDSIKLLTTALADYHRTMPLAAGISKARLKGFLSGSFGQREYDSLLKMLQEREEVMVRGDLVSSYGYQPVPSGSDRVLLDKLINNYRAEGLQPLSARAALEKAGVKTARQDELFAYLVESGTLVKVSEELYFHSEAYGQAADLLRRHFKENDTLTLAQYRDLTGSSRKFVQALLEYFDQLKLTRRVEDHRVAFKLDLNL
jgi:selenocysteine-specific elongation factor